MPRHVDPKKRLKQLQAQQADVIDCTYPNPPPAQEELKLLKGAIAARGGRATDDRGEPHPDVMDAFETYVAKARQEIGWPDRLERVSGWVAGSARAWTAFRALVAAGADPHALAYWLREWIWAERVRHFPAFRHASEVRELAKRAMALGAELEGVYEDITVYWRRSFVDSPDKALEAEGFWLLEVANSLKLNCGDQMPVLTAIQEHLVDRTGARHDELLATVLNSLRLTQRKVTAKSLATRFARRRSRKARNLPEAVRERMLLGGTMEPVWVRRFGAGGVSDRPASSEQTRTGLATE